MQKSSAVAQADLGLATKRRIAIGANSGWEAVPWSWSCVMVVSINECNRRGHDFGGTLLVNPSSSGLRLISELDAEIESISLFFPPRGAEAPPRTEVVQKILPWPSSSASGQSMALCCASGSVFICSESELQPVESATLWSKGTKYDVQGAAGKSPAAHTEGQ